MNIEEMQEYLSTQFAKHDIDVLDYDRLDDNLERKHVVRMYPLFQSQIRDGKITSRGVSYFQEMKVMLEKLDAQQKESGLADLLI